MARTFTKQRLLRYNDQLFRVSTPEKILEVFEKWKPLAKNDEDVAALESTYQHRLEVLAGKHSVPF